MRLMARLTITLVSLSLVLTSGNPAPDDAQSPTNQKIDSKAPAAITPESCQNSQVKADIHDHYYFVPSMGRAGNDCNVTGQYKEDTLQNRAKQLCHLTDFYLQALCSSKDMAVPGPKSDDPCTILPQLAKTALDAGDKDKLKTGNFVTMMEGFATKNDGSPDNNYCQETCHLDSAERFHSACDDLRRALESFHGKSVIPGLDTMSGPGQANQPDPKALVNPAILNPPKGGANNTSVKKELPGAKNNTQQADLHAVDQANNALAEKADPVQPESQPEGDQAQKPEEPQPEDKGLPSKDKEDIESDNVEDSDDIKIDDGEEEPKETLSDTDLLTDTKETSNNKPSINKMPANPASSEETPSYFLSYFFALTIICIAGYLIYHNKNKLMGLVLEGRKPRNGRRQRRSSSSSARYRKLDNNLEEAMGPNSETSFSQVVY